MNSSSIPTPKPSADQCESIYQYVMITLTLPLWTFIIVFLIILIIHYLRKIQYFSLYDRCTSRNAHFRYDFHLIVGRHSVNYNRFDSMIILDLLDKELVSSITIQIPGSTIFNNSQVFVYKHPRPNVRCLTFTIYRKHPIMDVRSIRVAHSCTNVDSRIYLYGLNLYDATNGEDRFFPVCSLIKNRGTQWALVTTFEPKNEFNFKKLGLKCHDPFHYTDWPTYFELAIIIFYVWCSAFCFGHLIPVASILGSVIAHMATILFICGSTASVIAFAYLYTIKSHINDLHYDSFTWLGIQYLMIVLITSISIIFWLLSTHQAFICDSTKTFDWIISTVACSIILTLGFIIFYVAVVIRKTRQDKIILDDTDNMIARTNSKTNIEFVNDQATSFWCSRFLECSSTNAAQARKKVSSKSSNTSTSKQGPKSAATKTNKNSDTKKKKKSDDHRSQGLVKETEETLDNAFGPETKYIKTKNRNSISQYI